MKRIASFSLTIILVVGVLTSMYVVQPVKAQETIYIRADGSIEPSTVPIQRDGDLYTLTENITDYGGIVVERDNVILDGANRLIDGGDRESSYGVTLEGRENVTIRSLIMEHFETSSTCIYLNSSSNNFILANDLISDFRYGSGLILDYSSNNVISGNNMTGGVCLWLRSSSNNLVSGNNIADSYYYGVDLVDSDFNTFSANNIQHNNNNGLSLDSSSNNSIIGNNITNNGYGISLTGSNNSVYHNNFVDNTQQADSDSTNLWDNGCEGNYWSDYSGIDANKDGIGDTPYVINTNNRDNYPLMHAWNGSTIARGPAVEWSKTYGTIRSQNGWNSIVQTRDGGFAVACTSDSGAGNYADERLWLVKTDATGNVEWNKTYGEQRAVGSSIVQTVDGGYAVLGNTIIGGYGIAWLVKTDSNGNTQWNKSYTEIGMQATVWPLIQTNDGGYVIAGCKEYYDGWVMKTDSNGTMQWSRSFAEVNNTHLQSVVQTSDGGFVAAGATQYPPFSGKVDAYVVKTDSDGNMTWSKEFSRTSGNDYGRSIVQTSDGGYAIAGETDHWGNADFWLMKTDASGNLLWDRTYGGTGWDGANCIVQTTEGGYALAGQTNSFGAGGNDLWLVKTDANGNIQWNKTCGGAGDDLTGQAGSSLVQTRDRGFAVAGYTNSFSGDGSYEVWLIKLAGPRTWVVDDDGPADFSTIQEAINAASDEDTIFVYNGTYYEHVVVNKTVSLIGENRETTIIDGNGSGIVVQISRTHINFSGFSVQRGEKGIYLSSSSGFNTISNNTITSCAGTIVDYALELGPNRLGHDRFHHNALINNYENVGVFGSSLSDYLVTMDTTNTVNGKPVYYLVNQSNLLVEPSTYPEIGYLAIINSINVTVREVQPVGGNRQDVLFAFTNSSSVEDCSFSHRGYAGIQLQNCHNVTVTECEVINHYHGIRVDESNFNSVKHNLIRDNFWTGIVMEGKSNQIVENNMSNYEENIALYRSTNNSIFHNNFFGGWVPLLHESYFNIWDGGYPSGGNYWSDYDGSDLFLGENQDQLGSDGIGDTHYVINENNTDHYPLMNPWTPPDAAALNITTSKRFIGEGYSASLTALVENQGNKVENLNVTVYVGETPVTFQTFLLKSGDSLNHTFPWNSTGFAKGNYTLIALIEPIEGEEDLADNTMHNDWVFITIPGDVNGDKKVNILDAIVLSNAIFSKPSEPNWNADADINNDGKVNILDCIILANHFNQHWA